LLRAFESCLRDRAPTPPSSGPSLNGPGVMRPLMLVRAHPRLSPSRSVAAMYRKGWASSQSA
jgi:hypothetical protein